VEMLVGSSLQAFGGGGATAVAKGKEDRGKVKLDAVRGADIVVATAGVFEHCICKVRPAGDLIVPCCVGIPCYLVLPVVRAERRGRMVSGHVLVSCELGPRCLHHDVHQRRCCLSFVELPFCREALA